MKGMNLAGTFNLPQLITCCDIDFCVFQHQNGLMCCPYHGVEVERSAINSARGRDLDIEPAKQEIGRASCRERVF